MSPDSRRVCTEGALRPFGDAARSHLGLSKTNPVFFMTTFIRFDKVERKSVKK